jgi:hypothetical protein
VELLVVKTMVHSGSSAASLASNRICSHAVKEEKEPKLEEASLLPDDCLGDLSPWVVTAAHNGPNPMAHKAIMEMRGYHEILDQPSAGHILVTCAFSINKGPFAFLMLSPILARSNPMVEVVHCTKEYILPISWMAAATNNSIKQLIAFVGETLLGKLPKLYMEPSTGLDELAINSECMMSSDDQVAAFYASHDTAEIKSQELLPWCAGVAIACTMLSRWMFIPTHISSQHSLVDCHFAKHGRSPENWPRRSPSQTGTSSIALCPGPMPLACSAVVPGWTRFGVRWLCVGVHPVVCLD